MGGGGDQPERGFSLLSLHRMQNLSVFQGDIDVKMIKVDSEPVA